MRKTTIYVNNINDLDDFYIYAKKVEGDVIVRRGIFCVDGKSYMGLIAIFDNGTPLTIEYPRNAIEFREQLINRFGGLPV